MENFSRFVYLLFVLGVGEVLCIAKIARVSRSGDEYSQTEQFRVLVTEEGSHFSEEVKVDKEKKSIVYQVPAHYDRDRVEIFSDFVSNLTVTRIPDRNVCYIRPFDDDEQTLNNLEESMKLLASKKPVKINGVDLRETEWTVKGPADLRKLRPKIINFCDGLPIYELELLEKDGVSVVNGKRRKKRNLPIKLCKSIFSYDLTSCPNEEQWNYICTFPSHNCVYKVTCNGLVILRDTNICKDNHILIRVVCCDLACK